MNTEEIVKKLDTLYWTDSVRYIEYLASIKKSGSKVYRNSAGKHKVQSMFEKIFGGELGDIFAGFNGGCNDG